MANYYLLCDQVYINIIFEVLVKFDDVRVVL